MEVADLNYYFYRQDFVRSTCKAGCKDKPIFCRFILPPLMPVYIALLRMSEVALVSLSYNNNTVFN